jgi:hypothetical protein
VFFLKQRDREGRKESRWLNLAQFCHREKSGPTMKELYFEESETENSGKK